MKFNGENVYIKYLGRKFNLSFISEENEDARIPFYKILETRLKVLSIIVTKLIKCL